MSCTLLYSSYFNAPHFSISSLYCPQGASIISMLESFIGRDMLKEGLQLYLRENEFGNAATDDLWAALTKVTQKNDNPLDIKVTGCFCTYSYGEVHYSISSVGIFFGVEYLTCQNFKCLFLSVFVLRARVEMQCTGLHNSAGVLHLTVSNMLLF